jgi:hypothetical protein
MWSGLIWANLESRKEQEKKETLIWVSLNKKIKFHFETYHHNPLFENKSLDTTKRRIGMLVCISLIQ